MRAVMFMVTSEIEIKKNLPLKFSIFTVEETSPRF
jgi:hypothetical protein